MVWCILCENFRYNINEAVSIASKWFRKLILIIFFL